MRPSTLLNVILALAAAAPARAQDACRAPMPAIDGAPTAAGRLAALRHDSLSSPVSWRGLGPVSKAECGGWLAPSPIASRMEYGSGYPIDRNNGSLWGGRGLNLQVSGGAALRWKVLSAAVRPEVNIHENRPFVQGPDTSRWGPFAQSLYSTLDMPERFGNESFVTVLPGQTFVRLEAEGWGVGLSTENLWWGPGLRESLLLSSTAPGFAHVFLETAEPRDIRFATVELSLIWGALEESQYFDDNEDNDRRMMTGFTLAVRPEGLPGLTLGASRLYTVAWDSISLRTLAPLPPRIWAPAGTEDNPTGNNSDDQRISLFFNWASPGAGMEVYGEYGREDWAADWRDYIMEIDQTSAYIVGFQKLQPLKSGRTLRVNAEWVNLRPIRDRSPTKSAGQWYAHSPQGHTHRGQLLGASIGPGADEQYLGLDVESNDGAVWRGWLERVRRHDQSGAAIQARAVWPPEHDTELTAGLGAARTFHGVQWSGQLSYSYRLHRQFMDDDTNVRLVLLAEWSPGW